jgi:fatty acid-binding protein DegV
LKQVEAETLERLTFEQSEGEGYAVVLFITSRHSPIFSADVWASNAVKGRGFSLNCA